MSFATPINNSNLEKSIKVATQKGIIITSACINLSSIDCYPALYENVISVSEGANPKADIIKLETSCEISSLRHEIGKKVIF